MPSNQIITTETLIESIQGLSPFQKKTLNKMRLKKVDDILRHFPIRYGEAGMVRAIEFLTAGENAVVFGKISKLKTAKTFKSGVPISTAELEDSTGKIKIVWFNQPYMAKMFSEESLVRIDGRVSERKRGKSNIKLDSDTKASWGKNEFYFSNPKIEKISQIPEGASDSLFSGARLNDKVGQEDNHNLSPVYPESRSISSNWIYYVIQKIMSRNVLDRMEDYIPEEILKKYHLPSLKTALIWIHAPRKKEDAEVARKRFAFEEIFFIQLDRQREKYIAQKEKAFIVSKEEKEIKEFIGSFPFSLTNAQNKSIEAILNDFKADHPMSRLLEGDVGSGKTAIAATVTYAVVTSGRLSGTSTGPREFTPLQVAYMAPTEILAEQHFESFIEYFSKYRIPIGLITGSGAKKFPSKIQKNPSTNSEQVWTKISKAQLLKWTANGEIPILIGTHSLIQKTVKFKNLALIIIDEQHRFGVSQRRALARGKTRNHTDSSAEYGKNKQIQDSGKTSKSNSRQSVSIPHLLSMTATPIPRTLALTIFGDLDLSLLDELPPGRQIPETKIILPHQRDSIYEKVRAELKTGRQVFVICPRINEPDPTKELAINAKSVIEEAKRLQEKIFPEFKVSFITGKMLPKEKEEVMRNFSAKNLTSANNRRHAFKAKNRIDILVATSVVEVGVDVPNATVMIIENAERFGLAQLHQLRGRILRSSHKPHCFVFADSKSTKTIARLKSFVNVKNGFELAEADLQQRGAGNFIGFKQWGVSDLAMEALKNIKMVEAARLEARTLIEQDFELKKYPMLAKHLSEKTAVHME